MAKAKTPLRDVVSLHDVVQFACLYGKWQVSPFEDGYGDKLWAMTKHRPSLVMTVIHLLRGWPVEKIRVTFCLPDWVEPLEVVNER